MSAARPQVEEDTARKAVADLLEGDDLQQVSLYKFRRELARHMGLGKKGLEDDATVVNGWIQEAVAAKVKTAQGTPAQRLKAKTIHPNQRSHIWTCQCKDTDPKIPSHDPRPKFPS